MHFNKYNFYLPVIILFQAVLGIIILFTDFTNINIYKVLSVVVFGVCGVFYIISFIVDIKGHYRPGWILPAGIAFLVGAVYMLAKDQWSLEVLFSILGNLAVFNGIIEFTTSLQYRHLEIKNWWIGTIFSVVSFSAGSMISMSAIIPAEKHYMAASAILFYFAFVTVIESFLYLRKNNAVRKWKT